MTEDRSEGPPASDLEEVRRVWNANASFWDTRMGEGNDFHRRLLLPWLERLLAPRPGERILDIACGNGQLSRWLAGKGAQVTAVDLSERMIELAKARTPQDVPIDYRVVDASDGAALRALGDSYYDAAVCNMALMDMPDPRPFGQALPRLLRPHGRFVMSVTHPCFNQADMTKVARENEEGGTLREYVGVEIRNYLTPRKVRGLAMIGQPEPQPYFERPLSLLLGAFLGPSLMLDALEEPSFIPEPGASSQFWFSWSRFSDIPPALIARFHRSV